MPDDDAHLRELSGEGRRLLAEALAADDRREAAQQRVTDAHAKELDDIRREHDDALARIEGLHAEQIVHLEMALAHRDVIAQAKGIIMATTRCTADRAFELLVRQSQHQNRKLLDIAGEITARATRLAGG